MPDQGVALEYCAYISGIGIITKKISWWNKHQRIAIPASFSKIV
jgi:hypothetical protein